MRNAFHVKHRLEPSLPGAHWNAGYISRVFDALAHGLSENYRGHPLANNKLSLLFIFNKYGALVAPGSVTKVRQSNFISITGSCKIVIADSSVKINT